VSISEPRIQRHAERARHERADLYAVLDTEPHLATLSTVTDGRPWVVPMLYARAGDRILLHGSVAAGALRQTAAGAPVALCVAQLDGWVYAHTLFDSSANYRSAVVQGELVVLTGADAVQALNDLSETLFPGRGAEVPVHTRKQLAATQVLALDITDGQWTVKVRAAGPGEPSPGDDVDDDLWTGVLPLASGYGEPQPAPRSATLPPSASVRRRIDGG
jgi:nitroimidazol reductase NimA-like FMN-containing flavoprotein (pyridoxamine 5'-phosphate oxidase superfamily)